MTTSREHVPTIAVIGLGPVGLTTVATLAEFGLQVTGLEHQPDRINALTAGNVPYYETGLTELITQHVRNGRITFTSDPHTALADADVVYLCVGTPKKGESYEPDLSQVYGAVEQILQVKAAVQRSDGGAGGAELRDTDAPGNTPTVEEPALSRNTTATNTTGTSSTGTSSTGTSSTGTASTGTASTGTASTGTSSTGIASTTTGMAHRAAKPVLIVEKSTVPPGTGTALEQHFAGTSVPFEIVSNPEFLREGTAVWDTLFPDRIVVGTNSEYGEQRMRTIYDCQVAYVKQQRALAHSQRAADQASDLHIQDRTQDRDQLVQGCDSAPLNSGNVGDAVGQPTQARDNLVADIFNLGTTMPPEPNCVYVDRNTAELIKHASNSFLATKISYINFIARICEATGANVEQVAYGMGLDQRISPQFLRAGLGYGGSCFPKDIRALIHTAESLGIDPSMLREVEAINERTKRWAVDQLEAELGDLTNTTICVLGYAFKPGTDDVREAPAIDLVTELLARGATVHLSDPVALSAEPHLWEGQPVRRIVDHHEAIQGCHAIVVATEWADFTDISPEEMSKSLSAKLLVDARNLYDPRIYRTGGLRVKTIGNKH